MLHLTKKIRSKLRQLSIVKCQMFLKVNCQRSIVKCRQSGYVALMSAIVISFLLIAITVSLGLNGFFGRFNILDSESKERSSALAEACVDAAILDAANGIYHATPAPPVPVGSDNCTIVLSQLDAPSPGETLIKTQACINKSFTNIEVVIKSNTFDVISWIELPNFIPNVNSCPS